MATLADRVRVALGSADPDGWRALLHPEVQRGPPGDVRSGCHNRDDVLACAIGLIRIGGAHATWW
jgi:hypothetical protein